MTCAQGTGRAAGAGALTVAAMMAAFSAGAEAPAPPALSAPATLQEAEQMMFGGADDIAFARKLWQVLLEGRLAGPDARPGAPREGLPPHGTWLEVFQETAEIAGETGALIVKRDYGPEDPGLAGLTADRGRYLDRIAVMFRRAPGWDPEIADWFWAEYTPDGTLTRTPRGTANAGAVGKNLNDGCIACHIAAAGNDYVFIADDPERK